MGPNNKILVVEDNDIIRGLLIEFIKHYLPGAVVYSASDGKAGWQLVNDVFPSAIITDIGMPELDGLELLKLVREKFPDIKVILHSAEIGVHQTRRETAISLGAVEAFTKPTDFAIIAEEIRKYLN